MGGVNEELFYLKDKDRLFCVFKKLKVYMLHSLAIMCNNEMPFYASICQVMCVSVSVLCVSAFLKACTLIVHVYVCKAL